MMRRALSALAIASCVLSIAPRARAETVNVDTTMISRLNVDGSSAPVHIVEGSFQGVGMTDCTTNTHFVFDITIPDFTSSTASTYQLQAWAGGGDCNASHTACWPITPVLTPAATAQIPVLVTDLVSNIGISPSSQSYVKAAPTSVCGTAQNNLLSTSTSTTDDAGNTVAVAGEATLNVFFMLFPIGGAATSSFPATAYPIKVKLTGPGACTGVTAASGNNELVVTWTAPGDLDIAGFNIYDALAGSTGDASVADAQTELICNDSGTELVDDSGIPIDDDAGNPIYVDDAGNPIIDGGCYTIYVPNPPNSCGNGTIDTTTATLTNVTGGTSTTITGLANDSSYEVAVVAYDSFGNTGTLSSVTCATPSAINDFWSLYNQDGGKAFCALAFVGSHGAPVFGVMMMFAFCIYLRRKKKTSR